MSKSSEKPWRRRDFSLLAPPKQLLSIAHFVVL